MRSGWAIIFVFFFGPINAINIDWIVLSLNEKPQSKENKIKKVIFNKCPSSILTSWILSDILNNIPDISEKENNSLSIKFIYGFPEKCVEVAIE